MKNVLFSILFAVCLFISAPVIYAQIGLQTSPVTYEKPVDSALVQISKLEPQQTVLQNKGTLIKSKYGFQPEEFEKVFPFMVSTKEQLVKADNFAKSTFTRTIIIKDIDYVSLVPVLVAAMQEQQAIIRKQQQQLDALYKLIHTK